VRRPVAVGFPRIAPADGDRPRPAHLHDSLALMVPPRRIRSPSSDSS